MLHFVWIDKYYKKPFGSDYHCCDSCGGSGEHEFELRDEDDNGTGEWETEECYSCEGTGKHPTPNLMR